MARDSLLHPRQAFREEYCQTEEILCKLLLDELKYFLSGISNSKIFMYLFSGLFFSCFYTGCSVFRQVQLVLIEVYIPWHLIYETVAPLDCTYVCFHQLLGCITKWEKLLARSLDLCVPQQKQDQIIHSVCVRVCFQFFPPPLTKFMRNNSFLVVFCTHNSGDLYIH